MFYIVIVLWQLVNLVEVRICMISKPLFVMYQLYISSAFVQVFNLTSCAACPGGCGMNVLLLFFCYVIVVKIFLGGYQYQ